MYFSFKFYGDCFMWMKLVWCSSRQTQLNCCDLDSAVTLPNIEITFFRDLYLRHSPNWMNRIISMTRIKWKCLFIDRQKNSHSVDFTVDCADLVFVFPVILYWTMFSWSHQSNRFIWSNQLIPTPGVFISSVAKQNLHRTVLQSMLQWIVSFA